MEIIAEKKKAILESTLKLIKENGFHGTPMSMVAKRAGVAAGTIYHYFDSKDTLIMELFAYTQYRVQEAMGMCLREDMDLKENFFLRWISRCRFYIQHPDVLFFMEQFVNSPYYPRCPQDHNERVQNEIKQFIEIGHRHGILRDLDQKLMAIMIHSSIMTAAKVHLDQKVLLGDKEFNQLAQMVWDSIRKL
ncbi:TetR/AcrR family transcriptional regulator [Rufibacter latericius]|uniref:TetR/AcrR family transcriptional regulator n=1 Tax=Rufibacter latericius TaxID=2487040 RepID=A0A3M9M9L9_9BACT|nr:TetR/AcrR family transcriptional regulator [Rufibacter latericius]RNI21905.1 TetR/AcrR family transcriptional regulator [Rufibacter latericius]